MRGDGELPLETHRQVDHDADDDHGQGLETVDGQFLARPAGRRTPAAQLHRRSAFLSACKPARSVARRSDTLLGRQADHHVARGAEVLHLDIGIAQLTR
jgi:hypothetical protein